MAVYFTDPGVEELDERRGEEQDPGAGKPPPAVRDEGSFPPSGTAA
jgi:hypothetical protein